MISYQPIKPNSIIINEFDNFLDPRPEVQYFVPFQDFDKWNFTFYWDLMGTSLWLLYFPVGTVPVSTRNS